MAQTFSDQIPVTLAMEDPMVLILRQVVPSVVLAGAALVVAGCGSTAGVPAGSILPGSSLPTRSVSSGPDVSQQDAVRVSYQRFWRDTWHLDRQASDHWQATVDQVAVEPERSIVLQGVRWHQVQGITLYGDPVERVTDVSVRGTQATVADCQDSGKSGQADAGTGKPKDVGVARNPVSATLTRGADGVWRVSQISFPGGEC